MAIVRYAPFSAFTSLEREMQEMLDRFTTRPLFEGWEWKPATDVYRDGGDLVVRAELPGIDPEEGVTVEVKNGVLHILGDKEITEEVAEDDRFVREIRYGSFRRDVVLPEGIDPASVAATFVNGILTVRVPLPHQIAEETEARTVKVEIKKPEPIVM